MRLTIVGLLNAVRNDKKVQRGQKGDILKRLGEAANASFFVKLVIFFFFFVEVKGINVI